MCKPIERRKKGYRHPIRKKEISMSSFFEMVKNSNSKFGYASGLDESLCRFGFLQISWLEEETPAQTGTAPYTQLWLFGSMNKWVTYPLWKYHNQLTLSWCIWLGREIFITLIGGRLVACPWVLVCCCMLITSPTPLQETSFLLRGILASELLNTSNRGITFIWMDSFGTPISDVLNVLIIAFTTTPKSKTN